MPADPLAQALRKIQVIVWGVDGTNAANRTVLPLSVTGLCKNYLSDLCQPDLRIRVLRRMLNPMPQKDNSIWDCVCTIAIERNHPLAFAAQCVVETFIGIEVKDPPVLKPNLP